MRKTFEAVPRLHELYDGGGDEKHYQRRLLAPGRLALENPIETELTSIAAKYYKNFLAVGPLSLKQLIDAAQAQTKAGRPGQPGRTGRSATAGLSAWTPAVGKVYGACLRNMKRTVGRLRRFQPEPDKNAVLSTTTFSRPRAASSLPDYNQPHRGKVIAFYKKHNPAKIHLVDRILRQYAGREEELMAELAETYGPGGAHTLLRHRGGIGDVRARGAKKTKKRKEKKKKRRAEPPPCG